MFTPEELRQVVSFLYVAARRDHPADAASIALGVRELIAAIEPEALTAN